MAEVRVLIVNESYSDNLGDQAIASAMRKFCSDRVGLAVDAADFSFRRGGVGEVKVPCQLVSFLKRYIPRILKRLLFILKNVPKAMKQSRQRYDLAIIGGGQLILSNPTFSLSMLLHVISLKFYGTRVKLVSVGVGSRFSIFDRLVFRFCMRLVDEIYVRDIVSKQNALRELNIDCDRAPDIAYYLDLIPSPQARNVINSLLVCPTHYSVVERYRDEVGAKVFSEEKYNADWVNRLQELAKKTKGTIVLSATTKADLGFATDLYNQLCDGGVKNLQLVECNNHEEFITLAMSCNAILSGRMHALILAQLLGLQLYPDVISQKLSAFTEEYLVKDPADIKAELTSLRERIVC